MNNISTYAVCLLWTLVALAASACPQWDADTPCTCDETRDGLMVQCTGPAEGQKIISALEAIMPTDIWNLQLEYVDLEELPSSIRTVSSLRLANCNIGRLQKTTPLVWPKLNEVVFESLKIRENPWPQLKGAHVLKSVKVSDFTMMRTIGQNFKGVSDSVEYLDIRKTGTTRLESGAMNHLKNLRYVFIADMPLSEFPRDVLPTELPQLHTFIVGNTLISQLEPNFFDGMPKLEVLMLNGNKFSSLDSQLFMPLKSHLTHLLAERNPLQCDCNLLWLNTNFQSKRSIRILATCYDKSTQEFREVMKLSENEYCS
ncbi:hypothetical protein AVEN_54045-1 [Araneus ventricosus]|uniref:Uncharacterized protein n=1 Tax=Araneus ventricosus TaxID=182803 RepID=A0A4Y2EHI2_ARAVE|nr:hypothetical protein AVEN_54045-1 [Araneus ventricosus]